MASRAPSVKDRLREYFRAHQGRIVTSRELRAVAAPSSEWARRVRELREDEGWPIATHNDRVDLKPGEYLLAADPPEGGGKSRTRAISQRLRSEVLDRDGYTCQMCGLGPGESDPHSGRPVRLHLGHIVDKSLGGKDELDNLRALCSSCNQGAKNVTIEKPTWIWLLAQIRRASVADQRRAYAWLSDKFSGSAIEQVTVDLLVVEAEAPPGA